MAPPRVLFVNHTSKISGAEFVLLDVVRSCAGASAFLFEHGPLEDELRARGLVIVSSRFGTGLSEVRRDKSLWAAAPLAGKLAAVAAEIAVAARRHDLVYANSQKAFVLAAFACAIARRPLIWHLHDIIDASHFGAAQRKLQITLANHLTTRVVVPSQASAAAFVGAGGRSELVKVVPNGVDLAGQHGMPGGPGTHGDLRRQLGLPEGPLVGVFSRLAAWKGQHVVLRALEGLPTVQCLIVGDSLFGEQDYGQHLKEMAERPSLRGRVHFLGHRSDVPTLMRAVDLVIHPSVDPEPFGRTLVEAMLAKVPLIASDAGAASDILEGGRAGTLVKPNDPEALAAAITTILKRPQDLSDQLAYAAERARTKYGVGQMLAAMTQVICQVAGEAHA
jgi:glycosyltransferase involved in cell wall biosynthesis